MDAYGCAAKNRHIKPFSRDDFVEILKFCLIFEYSVDLFYFILLSSHYLLHFMQNDTTVFRSLSLPLLSYLILMLSLCSVVRYLDK